MHASSRRFWSKSLSSKSARQGALQAPGRAFECLGVLTYNAKLAAVKGLAARKYVMTLPACCHGCMDRLAKGQGIETGHMSCKAPTLLTQALSGRIPYKPTSPSFERDAWTVEMVPA